MSSLTEAFVLNLPYTSMVNRVLALLKIDVKSLIRAAIITAIINPLRPNQDNDQHTIPLYNINTKTHRQVVGITKYISASAKQ